MSDSALGPSQPRDREKYPDADHPLTDAEIVAKYGDFLRAHADYVGREPDMFTCIQIAEAKISARHLKDAQPSV